MSLSYAESSRSTLSSAMSDLGPRVPELVAECVALCATEVPELADRDLESTLVASCEANIVTMISMLQTGEPVASHPVPPGALALARELVHLGAEPDAILRAYRVGHSWFQDLIVESLAQRIEDVDELRAAMRPATHWLFKYIDAVCDQLTAEYEAEQQRWLPSAAALRATVIRSLVSEMHEDPDGASQTLGYELRRSHVAFVAWTDAPELAADVVLAEALTHLAAVRPLVHVASPTTAWAWIPGDEVPELPAPPNGVWVACGAPGSGVRGFSASHREALEARRIVELSCKGSGSVTSFRDVELAAMATVDLPRAREFVKRELGELAAPTIPARRLRETVRAVFEEDSLAAAADRVAVHYNTVVYRLRRAEEILGRPVTQNELRLQIALHLVEVVGFEDGDRSSNARE